MIPQLEHFLKYVENLHEGKIAKRYPSGTVIEFDHETIEREFFRKVQPRLSTKRMLTTFCSFCRQEDFNISGKWVAWYTELDSYTIPELDVESFNYYRADQIVVASFLRPKFRSESTRKEIWVNPYRVINRRNGRGGNRDSKPYLVPLAAGHFTAWYLIYADSREDAEYDFVDTCPELVRCDPDDYHENDIRWYDDVPVFSDTMGQVYPANRVNYRAHYFSLFEGSYEFPKDRK